MERKKIARREKALDALGLTTRRERQATRSREDAARRSTPETTRHDERPKPPHEPARRDPRLERVRRAGRPCGAASGPPRHSGA